MTDLNEEVSQTVQPPCSKDALDHAWRYFALHAAQRMSMFNYFIIIVGVVVAGMAACLRDQGPLRGVGVLLGACLLATAHIFWKLDERTLALVNHGKKSIAAIEREVLPNCARLLASQDECTADPAIWEYTKSFRVVFRVAGMIGFVGAAYCWWTRMP